MKIVIKDIIETPYAILHEDGLKVYAILQNSFEKGEEIEFSFANLSKCSTLFLNACIGKLYLNHTQSEIEKLVSYDFSSLNLAEDKLNQVINNALKKTDYDTLVANASA